MATSRYSRWRVACLVGVHLLIAAHIAHWLLSGRTLAPLELNEVLYTLHLGVVTAGFVFMALAMASVVVFGRFFCSWACHILALQDLSAWLLGKLRIRPEPFRSRTLLLVPVGAMLYMFAWPQLARVLAGRPMPALRVWSDAQGWASFVTVDFWRNLPGPGITLLTFAVCGFAIVYLLGSRAFCETACPYGALFGMADRLAPGRIVLRGACTSCGACTAACASHVRVAEEVQAFGAVVHPGCLKDLDCVGVCPEGALAFGFAGPSLGKTPLRPGPWPSLAAELLVATVFIATLLAFRGVYDAVPFLLALGIAVIAACLVLRSMQSRRLVAATVALLVLTGHSAFVRYHEHLGQRAFERVEAGARGVVVQEAREHLEAAERFGVYTPPQLHRRLASLHLALGEPAAAEERLRAALLSEPEHIETRLRLGVALHRGGKLDQAERVLEGVVQGPASLRAEASEQLGALRAARDDREGAIAAFQRAVAIEPNRAAVLIALGALLAETDRLAEASLHLDRAVSLEPSSLPARNNLGVVLQRSGRLDEAGEVFEAAIGLEPTDPAAYENLGGVRMHQQRWSDAEAAFLSVVELGGDAARARRHLAWIARARRGASR